MSGRTTESPFPAPVSTRHHPVPIALAGPICDVWSRVLSRTRYGNDSQGETVPAKLAALGHNLKDYVQDPANQEVFLKVIEDHLEWLHAHSH
jgi:hypothetical protein